jgi:glycosyltransferase involved in cell wall biosynthesis
MKKILFGSGDFPYFGGAATNIYALTKWLNSKEDFKAICVINYTQELTSVQLDPDNTDAIYHIKDWKNKNIKNDILNLLGGEPDIIYIKKYIVGHYLKILFPETQFIYILSSVISSEYDWHNKDKTTLYTEGIIPKCIRDLTFTDKIIANSEISKKILFNFNNNVDISVAYTSFIVNHKNDFSFLKIDDNTDSDWQTRKYDFAFASSCCNREIKNIKLFIDIINNNEFSNKNKIIIGKNSHKYTNIDNCTCLDILNHDTLMQKLKDVKLVIISSYYESLSNFMIEALNSGCNILISDTIGGSEFIIDECVCQTKLEFIEKANILLQNQVRCIKPGFNYTEEMLFSDLMLIMS